MKDMLTTVAADSLMINAGFVVAGLLLGAGALMAWQKLHAWREQRYSEWDPY